MKPMLIIEKSEKASTISHGTDGKYILEGVLVEFNHVNGGRLYTYDETTLIKERDAVPNYRILINRVENIIGKIYTDEEFNTTYIECLNDIEITIQDYKHGYICDSSDIIITSNE